MSTQPTSPEHPRTILSHLIQQRRSMRRDALDHGLREANRLAIVYWQRQLSEALDADEQKPAGE
jgi:hypothetical protein